MATLTSVNALKTSIAAAERQVQRDQSQVLQDSARLDQSQAQLSRDQQRLNSVQPEGRAARAEAPKAATAPRLEKAIAGQGGAAPAPARAQINVQGQTIGTLINIAV